jgi:hypothetical protein
VAIKASLTSFMDFTSAVGPQRARIPADLRAMYEDPTRHPWDYYGPMIDAIKSGLTCGAVPESISPAVVEAQGRALDRRCRGQAKHYAAIEQGMLKLGRRIGHVPVFTPPAGSWIHGDLSVRVSPHLGIIRNGKREAWLLHVKDPLMTQATADAALIIMAEMLRDETDVIPRVVDVRRATIFGLSANRSRQTLSTWVRGEAELFARLWERAAA